MTPQKNQPKIIPPKNQPKIIPPQKSSIFNRLITLQLGHPINPEVLLHKCQRQPHLQFCCEKRNKIAKNNETKIQESLLLLAYERFQQSQQRQPLVSLPMGFLANLRFFFVDRVWQGPTHPTLSPEGLVVTLSNPGPMWSWVFVGVVGWLGMVDFGRTWRKHLLKNDSRDGKFGPDVSAKKHNGPTKRNHKLM